MQLHVADFTYVPLAGGRFAWVHWYNTSRLMHRLGRRPPAEAEHYATRQAVGHPSR